MNCNAIIIFSFILLFLFIIIPTICCCVIYKRKKSPLRALVELPKFDTIKPLKICIFMIVTPEIHQYSQYSIEINKKYAKHMNYSFKIFGQLTPDLPINFSKLQATLELMKEKYDYIMHIDADAIFIKQNYPIEGIIQNYPNKSFIVGEDCYNYKVCSKPGHINSGVYIVKNDYIGKNIIKLWLRSVRTGKCKKYKNVFPNCQLVFSHCVQNSIYRPFIQIVPYNLLNGKDGLFIKHLMQHTTRERVDYFKQQDPLFQKGEKRKPVF